MEEKDPRVKYPCLPGGSKLTPHLATGGLGTLESSAFPGVGGRIKQEKDQPAGWRGRDHPRQTLDPRDIWSWSLSEMPLGTHPGTGATEVSCADAAVLRLMRAFL